MKRVLLAVGLLAAVSHPAQGKPRKAAPWVSIRPGQASRVCAGPPDHEHKAKHKDGATFFFDLSGARIEAGDALRVTVAGTKVGVIFDHLDGGTLTFAYPAGIGQHVIRAEWIDHAGRLRGQSETWLGVFDCDAPGL